MRQSSRNNQPQDYIIITFSKEVNQRLFRILFIIEFILVSIGLVWLVLIYENTHNKKDNTNKKNQNAGVDDTLNIGDIGEYGHKICHINNVKQSNYKTKDGHNSPKYFTPILE